MLAGMDTQGGPLRTSSVLYIRIDEVLYNVCAGRIQSGALYAVPWPRS